MHFNTVSLELNDGIALLTLNRPKALNALNMEILEEARAAIETAERDPAVHVVLITGAGEGFCSGADLKSDRSSKTSGRRVKDPMLTHFNPLVQTICDCKLPVVAAVNGVAAGGGMSLALAADIVVAARSADFIQVFVPQLAIIPDMGSTWHLQRLLGRARAMGLAMLGDRVPAEKAEDWGMIWKCVDDEALMGEAIAIARTLRDGPTETYMELRRVLSHAETATMAEQLEYERKIQNHLTAQPNFKEGVSAFIKKRKPKYEHK